MFWTPFFFNNLLQSTVTINQATGGITIPATTPTSGNHVNANSSGNGNCANTLASDDLSNISPASKRLKLEITTTAMDDDSIDVAASETSSTSLQIYNTTETLVPGAQQLTASAAINDDSENEALIVDCESPMQQQPGNDSPSKFSILFYFILSTFKLYLYYLNIVVVVANVVVGIQWCSILNIFIRLPLCSSAMCVSKKNFFSHYCYTSYQCWPS